MTTAPRAVDLALDARWVLPIEPADTLLEEHAVIVDAGRIEAVLPSAEARRQYAPRETVALGEHVLMPGLVNAHGHAPMSLMRGLADDLPLMEWLEHHIWPVENAIMGPEYIRDGTELAVAEMLLGGTTCSNEHYLFPDVIGATCARLGFRACVGLPLVNVATAWAGSSDEYFERARATHAAFESEPLLTTAFAPHAPYTVDDADFERLRADSDELGIRVHLHTHETEGEVADSMRQYGVRPLERLERLGLVDERLIAVHMTAVNQDDIDKCAEAGVSVVHCPESNLKLASGFCPAQAFSRAGVNLAIGTDGSASNNDLDMFGEMRSAALLGKAVAQQADAMTATTVLEAATLGGARAMGLDASIGSIVPGKQADLIAVRMLGEFGCQPLYDVRSQLVYDGSRKSVTDVWVSGNRQVPSRDLVPVDTDDVRARARRWRDRIAAL